MSADEIDMDDMDDLDVQLLGQMASDFMEELLDHLDRLNLDLARLEENPQDQALIHEIFRIVHTVKGTASFVGLDGIRDVAHVMEDVFGAIRKGSLAVTTSVVDVMFEALAVLTRLRERAGIGASSESGEEPDLLGILPRLKAVLEHGSTASEKEPSREMDSPGTGDQPPEASHASAECRLDEAVPRKPASGPETIRVSTERLDGLMNLVGGLITSRNRLNAFSEGLGNNELTAIAAGIDRLTGQLHRDIMGIRMVPIEKLFDKFPAVVRNLARELSKEVRLVVLGKETELDKAIVEQMHDPLVHLLRNAVDHGIESAAERRQQGKPSAGLIRLSAWHQQNGVVIEISDDGRGIDPEKIKETAVGRALITRDQARTMTDDAAVRLIFAPGFTTADGVTGVSGRGVGMDVVKESIRKLRGIVDIETASGRGATFRVQLPLTLAVLQVLLVRVSGLVYALPLGAIRETLLIDSCEIRTVEKSEVVFIRGQPLPLRRMESFLKRASAGELGKGRVPVVVVGLAEKRMAVTVDALLDKQEVVIKSLGDYLGEIAGIEGAAVLADGSVTLVVDTGALLGSLATSLPSGFAA